MRKKLFIFGTGTAAEVAHQIISEHFNYHFGGFIVDEKFKNSETYIGESLYSFEDFLVMETPESAEIFVSLGYNNLNAIRKEKCEQVKEHGFCLASLIHPKANLPKDFCYGENSFIMNDVHIHPCVKIGKNNFLWSGTILCHHVQVGNDCWFTSGSMVAGNSHVGNECFFGIGAVVTNDLTIGNRCFIGAGSLVSKNTDDNSVVIKPGDPPHKLSSDQFLKLISNNF